MLLHPPLTPDGFLKSTCSRYSGYPNVAVATVKTVPCFRKGFQSFITWFSSILMKIKLVLLYMVAEDSHFLHASVL